MSNYYEKEKKIRKEIGRLIKAGIITHIAGKKITSKDFGKLFITKEFIDRYLKEKKLWAKIIRFLENN